MKLSAHAEPWTPPGVQEGLWVPPRYATPRNLEHRTTGPGVELVAKALGLPLMPWQRYVATVGGEVDARGLYRWPLVIVSVPRQSGKSALMLAKAIHRCLAKPNQEVWFTAQTGKDAADLYRKFVQRVLQSPLRQYVAGKPAYRGGSECLTFTNGSTLRPFAPGRDALHGKQSDDDSIDEGWAFDEAQGADLFQAITPTHATRPGAQTWVWSTRGDAASTWFHNLVARGEAGEEGVALMDWGIPAGAPVDVPTLVRHHPAVGYTQTPDSLRAAMATLGDKPAELARAYGNRSTGGRERVIPPEAWEAARTLEAVPAGRPAYGVGVWEPRNGGDVSGALVAAVAGPDGVPVLELVEARPGRAWLVDRVLELKDAGQGVAIVRNGPAGPVADALEVAGVELLELGGVDYSAACQDLWDRLCDSNARAVQGDGTHLGQVIGPRVRHRDHPVLDAAVDVAGRRFTGPGAWVWSPKESTGDTAALEAFTLATWACDRAPAPVVVGRAVFA